MYIDGVCICKLDQQFPQKSLMGMFPPRLALKPTRVELERRRLAIETTMWHICDDYELLHNKLLAQFFFESQIETLRPLHLSMDMTIFLANGECVVVSVLQSDQSARILEKALQKLNVDPEYHKFFGLFIQQNDSKKTLVRQVNGFELIGMTVTSTDIEKRIVIRRSYWNMDQDFIVAKDACARKLLFIQIAAELEDGWISAPKGEHAHILARLRNHVDSEVPSIIRLQPRYGHVVLEPCKCSHTSPSFSARITVCYDFITITPLDGSASEAKKDITIDLNLFKSWSVSRYITINNAGLMLQEMDLKYMEGNTEVMLTIESCQIYLLVDVLQSIIREHLSGTSFPIIADESVAMFQTNSGERAGPSVRGKIKERQSSLILNFVSDLKQGFSGTLKRTPVYRSVDQLNNNDL